MTGFQGKVNKPIKFDEHLRLKHFMTAGSPDTDPQYELLAVLVHLDVRNISSFGHYVAFVLGAGGKWFVCDDSQVEEVSKEVHASPSDPICMHLHQTRSAQIRLGAIVYDLRAISL